MLNHLKNIKESENVDEYLKELSSRASLSYREDLRRTKLDSYFMKTDQPQLSEQTNN